MLTTQSILDEALKLIGYMRLTFTTLTRANSYFWFCY